MAGAARSPGRRGGSGPVGAEQEGNRGSGGHSVFSWKLKVRLPAGIRAQKAVRNEDCEEGWDTFRSARY